MSPRARRVRSARLPRRRRWPWVVLALLLVLGLAFGIPALWLQAWLDEPLFAGARPLSAVIPRGTSFSQAVERLERARILDHPFWFKVYAALAGGADQLKAGTYAVAPGTTPRQLLALLRRGAPDPYLVLTLPEGLNAWQTAERIAALGLADSATVLARFSDPALASRLGVPCPVAGRPAWAPCLEGLLYPDTYRVALDEPLERVVTRLVQRHRAVFGKLEAREAPALAAWKKRGYGPAQLVTLASLVQAEARLAAEAPVVAGVFRNRLERNIPLASDPTLVYHPAHYRERARPHHRRDRQHPYNTYVHAGLPPGPICSPGEVALRAAVAPQQTPYLFFVARQDGTGSHQFSRTIEEHRAAIRRYLQHP